MKKRNNTIKISKFMIIGIIFLFVIIIIKMCLVVLSKEIDGMNLTEFANGRNTASNVLYAHRGNIYDKNGELLARNVNAYTVIAYLDENRTKSASNPRHVIDKQMTAEALEPILLPLNAKMTKEYILSLLNNETAYQVELGPGGRDISEVIKNEIIKLDLPGIDFISGSKRYYPMDNFAAYLIGYAKKNDAGEIVGEMGIEQYYNDVLNGTDGYERYQQDAYGYSIPNSAPIVVPAQSGDNIYLTIDNNIQLILEDSIREFENDFSMDWISVTIADAKSGAILGSATDPSFNPNTLDIENYVNPLVGYQYEPGSTMKIYSWMASIDKGIYDGAKTYKSGTYTILDDIIRDANRTGWGTITFDEGFYYSSNVAAANLASKLGRKGLRDFYDALGFGAKTGIELPGEVSGKTNFVYDIEVATAAFGQGITTTPIQNVQALSAIANEGVMLKPYIIDKIVSDDGTLLYQGGKEELRRVSSKETADKVKDLMHGVIEFGYTVGRVKPENVTVIGKSGTAQIAGKDGNYIEGDYQNIRSFSGMFPYEDPEYIIYFVVQKPIIGSKDLFERIFSIVDAIATKDTSINENINKESSRTVKIDNYLNKNVEEVIPEISRLNLQPIILGSGSVVINQYPPKNTTVIEDTKVFVLTNKKEYLMPNVIGWSSNEITTLCKLIGLKYKVEGYGRVGSVSMDIGSVIDLNAQLTIALE